MIGNTSDMAHQLGILCGLMFIPHIYAVFFMRESVFGFFEAAGFRPVAPFVYFCVSIKIFVSICLILGLWLPFTGALAGIYMLAAGASVWKVSKGRWLWNLGGCELHFFWATCCLIVAAHS